MARLSITTLGAFEIRLEGAPAARLKAAKARALLAYLALEAERPHRREALAELLWPGRPGADALGNLRAALFDLRRGIDDRANTPPHLLVQRETIQFNQASDHWLDAAAILRDLPRQECDQAQLAAQPAWQARMEEAVRAYTGRFLDGFMVDSEEFNEWVVLRREELERRVLAGLRCLATLYQARGDYAQAQQHVRRQLELEPWNEQAHCDLMRLLALDGRRSAALAHFTTVRRLLKQELNVDPAPETVELQRQIRAGYFPRPPQVVPKVAPAATAPPATAQPAAAPARRGPAAADPSAARGFVDRNAELARLDDALRQMLAGRGGLILVCGDPGAGKTALAQRFALDAMQHNPGLVAALGRCSAHDDTPLLPWREIVQALAGDFHWRPASDLLGPEHARRLRQAAPLAQAALDEIRAPARKDRSPAPRQAASPPSPATDQGQQRQPLPATHRPSLLDEPDPFQEVSWVLRRVASRHPLLLIVENLHWADAGTLGLLLHLVRHLPASQILLIGTLRPQGCCPPQQVEDSLLASALHEIRLQVGDVVVDLDQTDGSVFVDAALDAEPNALEPAFRGWLRDLTAGTPLFVVELLEQLRQQGALLRDQAGRWIGQPAAPLSRIPPKVEAILALRLGRLPEPARRLLEVASVRGPVFAAEVVAPIAGLAPDEAVRLLSGTLSRAERLVVPQEVGQASAGILSRYRFRHGLMQQYLYRRLDEAQRVYYHRAMAEALEARLAEDASLRQGLAPELAWQFEQGRLPDRAAAYRELAGAAGA